MKFYDETKPLYLETDASRIGLGAGLLQTRDDTACPEDIAPDNTILRPIAFASKCLTSAEHRYSNTEREALGILHGLKKCHHYCFAREVSIIMDHKLLVAIFKEDVVTLLHSKSSVSPQDTSILDQNTGQTGAGDIHHRLAVPTESH